MSSTWTHSERSRTPRISSLTLGASRLQAKLRIGPTNDGYEREADSVADRVMRMPEPSVQRKCAACEEEDARVQRKESGAQSGPSTAPGIVHDVVSGGGRPLDPSVRSFMEPRFGHDFGGVRIHTGDRAAESARSVNAMAYTVGQNVVFGDGAYRPENEAGRRLIAHELTHVVQQGSNRTLQRRVLDEESAASADVPADFFVGNTMDFVQTDQLLSPDVLGMLATVGEQPPAPSELADDAELAKGPEDGSKKKMGGPLGPVNEGMGKQGAGGQGDCKEWTKIARTTYGHDTEATDSVEKAFLETYKDFKEGVPITKPEDFNQKLKAATANPCTCLEDLKVDGHGGSWSGGAQEFAPRRGNELGKRSFGVKKDGEGNIVPYNFDVFDGIKFCKPCKITLGGCYVGMNTPKAQAGAGGFNGAGDALGKALAKKTGCSVTAYTDLTTTPSAGEFKGSGAGEWKTTNPEDK